MRTRNVSAGSLAAERAAAPASSPAQRAHRYEPSVAALSIGMALVAALAVAKRPEGDLAVYLKLVSVVDSCDSVKCVLLAGDSIQPGVLRDPAFGLLVLPFFGNGKCAIAVLAILVYGSLSLAAIRVTRGAGVTVDIHATLFIFALTLALLPVTLGTHLLRQSLVSGAFLLAITSSRRWLPGAATVLLLFLHRAATAIAAVIAFVPPWFVLGGILASPWIKPLVSDDLVSYGMQEQRTGTTSIFIWVAVAAFVFFRVRKKSRLAGRLAANCIVILAALTQLGESLATTRTFTSCILLLSPAFAVAALVSVQRLENRSRALALAFLTVALASASAYRDFVSPFSYDLARLLG